MYTLAENIFAKPRRADPFKHVAVKALLLFDDGLHASFAGALHPRLEKLNHDTGHEVAFFAATRTPFGFEGWQGDRNGGVEAFKQAQVEQARLLTPEARSVLVGELARRFDLALDDLPAVVVTEKLWEGPYLVAAGLGSVQQAEVVLEGLVDVARWLRGARDRHLAQGLAQTFGASAARFVKVDTDVRRLRLLGALAADLQTDPSRVAWLDRPDAAAPDLAAVHPGNGIERFRARAGERWEKDLIRLDEHLLDAATAREFVLVQRGSTPPFEELSSDPRLDEESRRMLRTWHRVRNAFHDGDMYGIDHAVVVAPLWKTVEREFNRSVFQLLRKKYGVEMPRFYDRHDPALGDDLRLGDVKLNALYQKPDRLRWPTLGQAHVLLGVDRGERPHQPGHDTPLTHDALARMQTQLEDLNQVRKAGSHTDPIGPAQSQLVHETVLESDLLPRLLDVKSFVRPFIAHAPPPFERAAPATEVEPTASAPSLPRSTERRRRAPTAAVEPTASAPSLPRGWSVVDQDEVASAVAAETLASLAGASPRPAQFARHLAEVIATLAEEQARWTRTDPPERVARLRALRERETP